MIPLERLQAGLVIPIDKPRQWTSFQAVNKVKSTIRRLYQVKNIKIGHAGTLDPLATGLLLVCVGKATKTIETLQAGDKEYSGTMVFGATTPCYDLERAIDHYYPTEHITDELVQSVRKQFIGDIQQVPPVFSAVKIAGQRAYTYARNDDPSAVIEPKTVHIESFDLKKSEVSVYPEYSGYSVRSDSSEKTTSTTHLYNNPQGVVPENLPQYDFHVVCGKGTYIRSLARDFGLALDSGAFLASLRRERVGDYHVKDAIQLEDIEDFFVSH
ncbi:MAG: tRNA pseudouridine(55) synthase TruB [Bacteroidales bacterium]|nr:tRNA pseudouridine(55) synthase TruB [Bacteroidales bacterium]